MILTHFYKIALVFQILCGCLIFSSAVLATDVSETFEKNREDIRHDKCIDYKRELDKVNVRLETLRRDVSEEHEFLNREQKRLLEEIKYYCD